MGEPSPTTTRPDIRCFNLCHGLFANNFSAAPKKKEATKLSLGEFLTTGDSAFGGGGASWADEVEDTYGTQPLPPSERRGYGGQSSYGGNTSSYTDRGYHTLRDNLPQRLPDKPPYTAHLGNLSYDATMETVTEFFEGCKVVNVRIIEDREQGRPKGFAYAEFEDLEGLKQALTLDGQSFQGRSIRIKIADPPKDRDGRDGGPREFRDLDWSARRGPLEDAPSRGGGERRGGGDFGERRAPREPQDDGKVRDFSNWERKGPLSPVPAPERTESRDGSRAPRSLEGRSESYRGTRRASPAWGPGEGRQGGDGSRPPRREFVDRPERVPSAADKDMQWRSNMRPDAAVKSPGQSREGSEAPPSPAPSAAQPVGGRPKLNLTKRTVSEAPAVVSPALSTSDSKANPFGAARPIDTAARERAVEERRIQAIKEKKEADEKAREERRLAKEAKEAAEKEAEAAAKAKAEAKAAEAEAAEAKASVEEKDEPQEESANGVSSEQKLPVRPREPKETVANPKSRATESGNWRSASGGDSRGGGSRGGHIPSGPRRGSGVPRGPRNEGRPPRTNGSGAGQTQPPQSPTVDSAPSTPTVDEDGWTTVPKGRRGGRP
ncbi:hypothetical protein QBC47DRAFT_307412 [Echria macrotheca]|uniref:RRM domain-containing protein n=1 Tax=Echria macrotheca TaxID=438768 RepID=A0AAJ0B5J2_9PEZI|nr:hypothetical protein QBC47DRAFT_307412 [Echria macrotheca]